MKYFSFILLLNLSQPALAQSEQDLVLGLFKNNCVGCHYGEFALKPLPLHDLTALRRWRSQRGASVLRSLQHGGHVELSRSDPQPTPEERELMIRYLSER